MRTGDTMRWPSFTQCDSAHIEVLLGNEVFGQAERVDGQRAECELSTQVNSKTQPPFESRIIGVIKKMQPKTNLMLN